MSLSIPTIYLDQTTVPPGFALQRIIQLQSAEATEMADLVAGAFAQIAAYNANPDVPKGFDLYIADADLAGAGDGHTFVCTLTFNISGANLLFQLLATLVGADVPLSDFRFRFCLAGDGEQSATLFEDMVQRAAAEDGTPAIVPAVDSVVMIWQATRGGAKGTRLMSMVGYVSPPEAPPPGVTAPMAVARTAGGLPSIAPGASPFLVAIQNMLATAKTPTP